MLERPGVLFAVMVAAAVVTAIVLGDACWEPAAAGGEDKGRVGQDPVGDGEAKGEAADGSTNQEADKTTSDTPGGTGKEMKDVATGDVATGNEATGDGAATGSKGGTEPGAQGGTEPGSNGGTEPGEKDSAKPAAKSRAGGESNSDAHGESRGGPQKVTGTLKSGYVGIGGEHTGWMLLTGPGPEAGIEVNPAAAMASAKEMDGKRVTITGRLVEKVYVERGRVKILVAEKIVPATP